MNNSLTSSNGSIVEILCPIDERRSSTELWVKFFVVHLTTVTALCHLLSIRGDMLVSWTPIFYILTPFNILVRHAAAVLVIFARCISVIIARCRHRRLGSQADDDSVLKELKISISWLIGKVPLASTANDGAAGQYSQLPTTNSELGPRRRNTEPRAEKMAKSLGRIIVILFFLTQCCATIYLYKRRRDRHAVALVDQRVFELACGGLLIGSLTLSCQLLAIKIPTSGSSGPDGERDVAMGTDRVVVFCRGSPAVPFLEPPEKDSRLVQMVSNGAISLVILFASQKFDFTAIGRDLASGLTKTSDYTAEYDIVFGYVVLGLYLAAIYLCVRPCIASADRSKGRRKTAIPLFRYTRDSGLPCIAFLCWPCLGVLFGIVAAFVLSIAPVIVIAWRNFERIGSEISAAADYPQEVACPLLWKDPVSEWLPWLA